MVESPGSILVIQTAYIGDAILATAVLEKLHACHPGAAIDFLIRKGNEGLFKGHPFLRRVLVHDKSKGKLRSLRLVIKEVRAAKYDWVVNLQRFASSGIVAALSGGKHICGFDKNPFSWRYDHKVRHVIGTAPDSPHEVERNQSVIAHLTDGVAMSPRLYPGADDYARVAQTGRYVCMAPTSLWFTKQWPLEKWVQLVDRIPGDVKVFLLGSGNDEAKCQEIQSRSSHPLVEVMAGKLNLLSSAALMAGAEMNYVNDSSPMHLCSAMDAPVTAIYCSTVPAFGFGPRSSNSRVVETSEALACRPCGLHGHKACPKGHFNCAKIEIAAVLGEARTGGG